MQKFVEREGSLTINHIAWGDSLEPNERATQGLRQLASGRALAAGPELPVGGLALPAQAASAHRRAVHLHQARCPHT